MRNPLRLAARRPAAVPEPALSPEHALRHTLQELRLEAERRPRVFHRVGGETRLPRDLPEPARTSDGAAADPLVRMLGQLRAVVVRHVLTLRAEGARPERMLVQVKALVRDAMLADGWTDPDASRALTAEVVRWSIDAYYDA